MSAHSFWPRYASGKWKVMALRTRDAFDSQRHSTRKGKGKSRIELHALVLGIVLELIRRLGLAKEEGEGGEDVLLRGRKGCGLGETGSGHDCLCGLLVG